MLRIYLENGIHTIPLDDRTAYALAEQLATIFAGGGRVLSMRVDDQVVQGLVEADVDDKPKPKRTRSKG